MKKSFLALMAVAAMTVSFISCDKEESKPIEEPKIKGDVQFRFYLSQDQLKFMDVSVDYKDPAGKAKTLGLKDCKEVKIDQETDKALYGVFCMTDMIEGIRDSIFNTIACYTFEEKEVSSWNGSIKLSYSPKKNAPYSEPNDTVTTALFVTGMSTVVLNDPYCYTYQVQNKGHLHDGVYCTADTIGQFCDVISEPENSTYKFNMVFIQ